MKFEKYQKIIDNSVNDLLEEIYNDSENKSEIDYWDPYSNIILESIQLRDKNKLTQAELAEKMNTTQSVISRFENMGRIPSYDFIARLSIALNNKPGMTLFGDYMAVVPLGKQHMVNKLAKNNNLTPKKFLQKLLEQSLENNYNNYLFDGLYISADNSSGFSEKFKDINPVFPEVMETSSLNLA